MEKGGAWPYLSECNFKYILGEESAGFQKRRTKNKHTDKKVTLKKWFLGFKVALCNM